MSIDDGLSYAELTTRTELVISSLLARSAAAADPTGEQRFRDLAHGALVLWSTLAYRISLKTGEVEQYVIDQDRLNAMFPESTLNI
ncbi:hypothetical protein ACJ51O_07905 [Burkholderia pyrrocinia]|uniref:hypothetical protein n=1 Tax=Burkholderia pyrrocinia TaxID=60550 RepID=UPI0038B4AE0A